MWGTGAVLRVGSVVYLEYYEDHGGGSCQDGATGDLDNPIHSNTFFFQVTLVKEQLLGREKEVQDMSNSLEQWREEVTSFI